MKIFRKETLHYNANDIKFPSLNLKLIANRFKMQTGRLLPEVK